MTCVRVVVGGKEVHIAGAAKGSGMIHPNMATMLGFMTTDVAIESEYLQLLLSRITDNTFNMITVDGDTSTNDMVVAMASGLAGGEALHPEHPDWEAFAAGFQYVGEYLAKAIARDGEGATKLIETTVIGAESDDAARSDREDDHRLEPREVRRLRRGRELGTDHCGCRLLRAAGEREHGRYSPRRYRSVGAIASGEVRRGAALAYLKGDTVQIHVNLHMGEGKATAGAAT